jgi:hypothetical protein
MSALPGCAFLRATRDEATRNAKGAAASLAAGDVIEPVAGLVGASDAINRVKVQKKEKGAHMAVLEMDDDGDAGAGAPTKLSKSATTRVVV